MRAHPAQPAGHCPTCRGNVGDQLTGLANRWEWDAQATRHLRSIERHGKPAALLLVDLDRFKTVNDDWGHLAGDTVLAAVADVLRTNVRDRDLTARYGSHGGDEFLVLLPHTDEEHARKVAERICRAVHKLSLSVTATSGNRIVLTGLTTSVGVAASAEAPTLNELILSADAALQRAKRQGRNRTCRAPARPDKRNADPPRFIAGTNQVVLT